MRSLMSSTTIQEKNIFFHSRLYFVHNLDTTASRKKKLDFCLSKTVFSQLFCLCKAFEGFFFLARGSRIFALAFRGLRGCLHGVFWPLTLTSNV